jgi:hypothetical protein
VPGSTGRSCGSVFSGSISVFFEPLFVFSAREAHEEKTTDYSGKYDRQESLAVVGLGLLCQVILSSE